MGGAHRSGRGADRDAAGVAECDELVDGDGFVDGVDAQDGAGFDTLEDPLEWHLDLLAGTGLWEGVQRNDLVGHAPGKAWVRMLPLIFSRSGSSSSAPGGQDDERM